MSTEVLQTIVDAVSDHIDSLIRWRFHELCRVECNPNPYMSVLGMVRPQIVVECKPRPAPDLATQLAYPKFRNQYVYGRSVSDDDWLIGNDLYDFWDDSWRNDTEWNCRKLAFTISFTIAQDGITIGCDGIKSTLEYADPMLMEHIETAIARQYIQHHRVAILHPIAMTVLPEPQQTTKIITPPSYNMKRTELEISNNSWVPNEWLAEFQTWAG